MTEPSPTVGRRLRLAEHPEWVWGVDRIVEEEGRTVLQRMTPALLDLWKAVEGRRIRSLCTAGVRLVLRTDARRVRLAASYGGSARARFQFDLLVDGMDPRRLGPTQRPEGSWSGEVFIQPDRSMRTLDVWFPHTAEIRLEWLEVDAGARVEGVPPPSATWLAIGDSITQGMEAMGPLGAYTSVAACRSGLGLRNTGVGGEIMLAELGPLCRSIAAHVATVAFGINDYHSGVPLPEFARRTRGLLDGLLAGRPGFPIGLITPTPCPGRPVPEKAVAPLDEYRRVLREVAVGYPSVRVLEGPELLPDDPKYTADGVHPNDEGMHLYGENLAPHLARLLAGSA